ncbi:hypothetical protein IWQ60_006124 [Tieghemiomyces parasiticus]|uniref:Guanine nucleotide exchange factor synembryn n=1 Tax=Tieghemiomyces parasiticus TaxID=78921 RepID=A0A9W8DSG7_9FUNG|nr:hypothetical protein IWQ60_006124 [Tieghemiomyces parasiticus]
MTFQVTLPPEQKRSYIKELITNLSEPKVYNKWSDVRLEKSLTNLKSMGRDPVGCERLFEKSSIQMLMTHGGLGSDPKRGQCLAFPDTPAACEALTCLANMFLINESTRDVALDLHLLLRLCALANLNSCSLRSHFLVARLLFLLTLRRPKIMKQAVDNYYINSLLAGLMDFHLDRLVSKAASSALSSDPFTSPQVLGELLKVAYNVTSEYIALRKMTPPEPTGFRGLSLAALQGHSTPRPSLSPEPPIEPGTNPVTDNQLTKADSASFGQLLQPAIATLMHVAMDTSSLSIPPPHSNAIALLLCYAPQDFANDFFPLTDSLALTERLADICDHCLGLLSMNGENGSSGASPRPDSTASNSNLSLYYASFNHNVSHSLLPLLWLLISISQAHIPSRLTMRNRWFPANRDRTVAPEAADTTGGRMVFILSQPMPTPLSQSVGNLLYNLWNHDVHQLVAEVGYGNAAGYLVEQGIPYMAGGSEAPPSPNSGSGKPLAGPGPVNPITGKIHPPPNGASRSTAGLSHVSSASPMRTPALASATWDKPMTEEEKEQEAEKLMVLFDRLQRTGVVEFEHPMAKAVQEGKFEEVESDSSTD